MRDRDEIVRLGRVWVIGVGGGAECHGFDGESVTSVSVSLAHRSSDIRIRVPDPKGGAGDRVRRDPEWIQLADSSGPSREARFPSCRRRIATQREYEKPRRGGRA